MKTMRRVLLAVLALAAFSCAKKESAAEFYGDDEIAQDFSGFSHDGIDFDMTQMSATMIFAQVFDMLVSPEVYIGKRFKIRGNFVSNMEENGKRYFACVVPDATACCQQGLSFIPQKPLEYPDGFPEENAEVTICGEYEYLEDGEYSFYYLKADELDFDAKG